MTVTAFHVIPFIVVFHTKRVYTVFLVEVIRLILGPSCEVPSSAIRPSKVTLRGDVVQTQPGFVTIVATLYVNVFFTVGDINKDGVLLSTFSQSFCPVCTFFTREVTEPIEIAPSRFTDVCQNV